MSTAAASPARATAGDQWRPEPERYARALAPAGAACLVAAVALGTAAGLPLAGVGVGLLALACYSRADGLLLFGPFVRAELTRLSRKHAVHRSRTIVFLLGVLPVLGLAYLAFGPAPAGYQIPPARVPAVAEGVFLFVGWHLFLIVYAMTSTFVSTAVTDEREGKRLDFLLVTDLRNREVVVGKAAARAAGAAATALPFLPLVILLPALFGVDPWLIVYSAGYAGVTVFSTAGLAVLGSVMSRTKRQASQEQVKFIFLYVLAGWLAGRLQAVPAVWFFPGRPNGQAPVSVGDLVDLFNAGNPLVRVQEWAAAAVGGVSLAPVAAAFPGYAAFHVGVGLGCSLLAVRRLRAKAAEFAGEGPPEEFTVAAVRRPPVYLWPVVWKEMYAVPRQYLTRRGRRLGWALTVLLMVVPAAVFLAAAVSDLGGWAGSVRSAARYAPPLLVWAAAAGALGVAAASVARERERDTLPSLLLTDLSPEELLWQKFLGVIGLTRGFVYWQLVVGIPGVLNGAFPWWAFLGLLVTQGVYTAASVALGLTASAAAPTAEKAARTVTLVFVAGLSAAAMIASLIVAATGGPTGPPAYVLVALLPPSTLLALPNARLAPPGTLLYWIAAVAAGWVVYLAAAWLLWRAARWRFLRACRQSREGGESAPPVVDETHVRVG